MSRFRSGLTLVALGLCACTDVPPTTALFAVPGASAPGEFYDLPFPNDLRRHADGRLDLSLFPTSGLLVEDYRAAAETLDGFGLNAAMFARFDGGLDPASLPDPQGSVADDASVYLVDVDPDSPERGQRVPITARFRAEGTQTLGGDHLVARPYPGFPLAEGTTYALVITRRVRGDNGGPVLPASELLSVFDPAGDPAFSAARAAYAPLLAYLDEPGGDERADVVSAAVFTTQHATFIAPAVRAAVFAASVPEATDVMISTTTSGLTVFVGNYEAPNFQAGAVPYSSAPDGEIRIGSDGAAIVQRMEPMRFALSVPDGPVPTDGWPLAIYQHGTGGHYGTFISDGTAARLAGEGIAVISTDQVLHGPRNPGGSPELDFFNFVNPYAARDNTIQGFADAWNLLRVASGLSLDDGERLHSFDPTRVYFFGHSQGGITGPGFVAFEPSVSGAVFTGTAGLLYLNLLYKTQPFDIPALVENFLRDDPVDEDNPSLALAQMWIERADAINYAPLMVRTPPVDAAGERLAPRNVFQIEGITDSYAPNPGIHAFATAIGGDVVMQRDAAEIPGLALRGRGVVPAPVTNNLAGKTAVLAQYRQVPGSDGHFVVFDIPRAGMQAAAFLGTLARTGEATVIPGP